MVEAPVFNITDGEYNEAQTVSIKTPTEGATIVYTLDGSEPREGSGIKYDSPVKIIKTAVIKAAAYKTGLVTSATVYLKIVITSVPVEPVIALLSVQAIETQTAGKGFSFMVKALDQSGELAVNDKPVEMKLSTETPDVACYASDSFAEKAASVTISGGMAKIYARGTKAGKAKIALSANGIETAAVFEISAAAAAKIAVTKEPSEKASAGIVLEQQPQVSLFDEFGNIASGPQTEVSASAGSAGTAGSTEVLLGTTKVKFVNGVASFDDLKFNAAGTFEIIFAASELSAKSIAVKVASAVFDKFDISSNSPQNAGNNITIKLTAFDSTGNIMKNYGGKTLLKLYNAAGNIKWSGAGLTSESSTEAALESTAFINGIAQFNINNEKVESDVTIAATDAASDFGAKTSISWKPIAADHFEISNISEDIPAGSSVEIKITAKDKFSNTVIDFNSETKLSDLSGTITPAAAADFINGVWTGVVVMSKPAQANKITAVSGNLSGESASFNIVPGAPAAIVMLVQPSSNSYANIAFSPQPSVKIQDAFGNDVKTAEVSVSATLKSGITGTLGGTLTALTDADGIAKFSGLRYSGNGYISLEFNADGLTKAESDRIMIIYLPLNPNLTSVTVNNTPKQGQVLTATPAYSNGAGTVTYLWSRSSDALGNTVTNSNLGTDGTYTLVAGDVGSYVFCVATASGSTTGGSKTSSVIGPITPAILLESGSVAGITADDTKITGLTATNKYVVITGGKVYGVTAGGTPGAENSDAAALTGTEITGLTNGTVYKAVDVTNLVLLETGSLGTADNTKITGLTATNKYVVITGGKVYGVTAGGTPGAENSAAAALTGTEITGLTNGTVYKAVDVTNLVLLETGSLGTANDTKITGLTTGKIYVVKTGVNYYGVLANGTLFSTLRATAALAHADAVALSAGVTEITGLTNGTTYKVTEEALVSLASGSSGTEGDTKITGLTATNKYVVITGGKVYGVTAGGTLGAENSDAAALTGTEITGLTNGTVYKAVDVTNLVLLETGSTGAEGDTKITGLTTGKIYVVKTGVNYYGVLANGTLFVTLRATATLAHADAVALSAGVTEITGLTNGTTYKVTEEALVSLASGSSGTEGDTKITGLTATNKYVVITGGKVYGVTADGTLDAENSDAAALTGTEIIGLTNGTVYKAVDVTNLVSLQTGSPGTADNTKITGLTATNKYVVITGGKVYGVTAGGTLGAENSDAAALTGTEITGLTNGTVYKAVDVTNLVLLETGSTGAEGDTKITGLTATNKYVVITGGKVYGVTAGGTLGAENSDAAALTGTEITGLTNGTVYKVVDVTNLVSLETGSLGTAGNASITGLTSGREYYVISGGTANSVWVNGTFGPLSALSGTTITGLTNGKTYKVIYSTTTVDSITYTYNGSVMAVTGSSATGAATILASVSGMPVTSIGSSAFINRTGLTGVTIPNSVTSINVSAFQGCSNLAAINVDADNPNYSSNAGVLYNKNQTTLILYPLGKSGAFTIPNSVTSIGTTFNNCTGLTSITIGSGIASVGSSTFQGCSSLTALAVDTDNPNYSSDAGVLYSKDQTILKLYPAGKSDAFTIPNSVTSIGSYSFENCTGLTSITIPDTLTSIGNYAFEGFTGLTSISIGTGVTSIGFGAFEGCTGLASITIPGGVTSIGTDAFLTCSNLTAITVDPANLNYSSNAGVLYNKDQTILKFYPGGKAGAFIVPNSVTKIDNYSIQFCLGLTSITIPEGVTSIGDSVFNGSTGLTSVTIPSSVTSIGISAFYNCVGLTSVSIGTGVTNIKDMAFRGCSNLAQVNFLGNAPTLGGMVFTGCAAGFKIHYLSSKTGWTTPTWNGYTTIFD